MCTDSEELVESNWGGNKIALPAGKVGEVTSDGKPVMWVHDVGTIRDVTSKYLKDVIFSRSIVALVQTLMFLDKSNTYEPARDWKDEYALNKLAANTAIPTSLWQALVGVLVTHTGSSEKFAISMIQTYTVLSDIFPDDRHLGRIDKLIYRGCNVVPEIDRHSTGNELVAMFKFVDVAQLVAIALNCSQLSYVNAAIGRFR